MTAFALSLFFGFAAFAALAVIRASIVAGVEHARQIFAELAASERPPRPQVSRRPRSPAFRPRCAAA